MIKGNRKIVILAISSVIVISGILIAGKVFGGDVKVQIETELPTLAKIDEPSKDDSTKDIMDESLSTFLDNIGMEDKTNISQTESGGLLVGDVAKAVHAYKSLAEGEEDMGYYLGLHNQIKSLPQYTLVGLYRIGERDWYQAIYSAQDSGSDIDKYPDITMKTSNKSDLESLIAAYEPDNYSNTTADILGEVVSYYNKSDTPDLINLVSFDVKNGKCYSLFTSAGVEKSVMDSILEELIGNLKIMDDWK